MAVDTLLTISGGGLPPYSARGLSETFDDIEAALYPRRTLNGTLRNLAPSQLQKVRLIITCTDQRAPKINGLRKGSIVTVNCATEIPYLTATESPAHSVVSGSSRVEGDYTYYRPSFSMMVMACPVTNAEWEASIGWEIELEEI